MSTFREGNGREEQEGKKITQVRGYFPSHRPDSTMGHIRRDDDDEVVKKTLP